MTKKLQETTLEQVPIDDQSLLAIGRLIRACADIEDIVTLYICKLSDMDESRVITFLGRSAISTRIALGLSLAKLKGKAAVDLHKRVFDANVERAMSCRNAVAHGTYLGRSPNGAYAFMTSTTLGFEGGSVQMKAAAYLPKTLADIADITEARAPWMEDALKLRSWRKKRKWQTVEELPADQQTSKKKK